MKKKGLAASVFLLGLSTSAFSYHYVPDTLSYTLGGFYEHQGKNQTILVDSLIGNAYTVTHKNDDNLLAGIGAFKQYTPTLDLGLELFYLAKTSVSGLIFQELTYDNLGYQYDMSHLPILATARKKILFGLSNERHSVVVDLGIGANVMMLKNYREMDRDNGITIPDMAFGNKTNVEFAVSPGVSLSLGDILPNSTFDIGYRFFYLGNGHFNADNTQLLNSLQTGDVYAHSLVFRLTTDTHLTKGSK